MNMKSWSWYTDEQASYWRESAACLVGKVTAVHMLVMRTTQSQTLSNNNIWRYGHFCCDTACEPSPDNEVCWNYHRHSLQFLRKLIGQPGIYNLSNG